jgi:hypothetical protein
VTILERSKSIEAQTAVAGPGSWQLHRQELRRAAVVGLELRGVEKSYRTPSDRIGAMLQAGGLLRDLTVRELVTMMAALYPAPLTVDEPLQLARIEDLTVTDDLLVDGV